MPISRRPRAAPALLLLTLALGGCRKDEITYARVPKEGPSALASTDAPDGDMAAGAGPGSEDVPAPPRPTGQGALKWALPKGWQEEPGGGAMRYATLRPPVEGKVEATVIVLPGPAGGELANVNRWRQQLGLKPLDEAALAGARKLLEAPAGEVALYDFTSEGQKRTRTVAGFTAAGGDSWFLKLTGDEEKVEKARADFIKILESLRLD